MGVESLRDWVGVAVEGWKL